MEEYIYPNGVSSLDVECCDCCMEPHIWLELKDINGEKFCVRCEQDLRADHGMELEKERREEGR